MLCVYSYSMNKCVLILFRSAEGCEYVRVSLISLIISISLAKKKTGYQNQQQQTKKLQETQQEKQCLQVAINTSLEKLQKFG